MLRARVFVFCLLVGVCVCLGFDEINNLLVTSAADRTLCAWDPGNFTRVRYCAGVLGVHTACA